MRASDNKKHSVTIKDIAKKLQVSVATVSRALRNAHDVNADTRSRVLAMAKQLNYKPNLNAVSLVKNSSNNIGVVLPTITNYYFSTVITGIQEVVYQNGFNMVLYLTNDSEEKEKEILGELSPATVDGLLVCVSSTSGDTHHFQQVIDNGVPIVFFDRTAPDIETSSVTQDDFNGAYKAVEHLIQCGYTKIAHIGGPPGLVFTSKRLEGYLAALKAHHLQVNPAWIIHSGFSQQCGEEDMQQLLAHTKRPDAVFAVTDRKAIGAMLSLKKNNMEAGRDIGVIGFTNDPVSEIIQPTLSTMEEPALEIRPQKLRIAVETPAQKKLHS